MSCTTSKEPSQQRFSLIWLCGFREDFQTIHFERRHYKDDSVQLKHVLHKLYTTVGHYGHNESDGNSSHDPLDYKKSDLNNYLNNIALDILIRFIS